MLGVEKQVGPFLELLLTRDLDRLLIFRDGDWCYYLHFTKEKTGGHQ